MNHHFKDIVNKMKGCHSVDRLVELNQSQTLLDLKIFEVYRQHEYSSTSHCSEANIGEKYSINQVMNMNDEQLNRCIFKIDYDPNQINTHGTRSRQE